MVVMPNTAGSKEQLQAREIIVFGCGTTETGAGTNKGSFLALLFLFAVIDERPLVNFSSTFEAVDTTEVSFFFFEFFYITNTTDVVYEYINVHAVTFQTGDRDPGDNRKLYEYMVCRRDIVHFYKQWATSIDSSKSGPSQSSIQTADSSRYYNRLGSMRVFFFEWCTWEEQGALPAVVAGLGEHPTHK